MLLKYSVIDYQKCLNSDQIMILQGCCQRDNCTQKEAGRQQSLWELRKADSDTQAKLTETEPGDNRPLGYLPTLI